MKAKNANAPSPYPLPVGEGKKRQRDWIPDLVGNDRLGRAGMTERGRGACGVSAPHAEGGGFCGVSPPHGEVLLLRQKDPKPWAPGRGPLGAFATVPISWAAELASLRQSSPPYRLRGLGRSRARRRLEVAPWDGAGRNVKKGEENRRMDPRLLMSRMTERGEGEDSHLIAISCCRFYLEIHLVSVAASGISQAGANVFPVQVWIVRQNIFFAHVGCEQLEDEFHGYGESPR